MWDLVSSTLRPFLFLFLAAGSPFHLPLTNALCFISFFVSFFPCVVVGCCFFCFRPTIDYSRPNCPIVTAGLFLEAPCDRTSSVIAFLFSAYLGLFFYFFYFFGPRPEDAPILNRLIQVNFISTSGQFYFSLLFCYLEPQDSSCI